MSRIIITVLILLACVEAFALRVNRPIKLKYPITEEQVSQLNAYLEEIWLMQNGRFEFDVVTSPKTNSRNGEIWLIQTGLNVRLQWKGNDIIWTSP